MAQSFPYRMGNFGNPRPRNSSHIDEWILNSDWIIHFEPRSDWLWVENLSKFIVPPFKPALWPTIKIVVIRLTNACQVFCQLLDILLVLERPEVGPEVQMKPWKKPSRSDNEFGGSSSNKTDNNNSCSCLCKSWSHWSSCAEKAEVKLQRQKLIVDKTRSPGCVWWKVFY